MIEVQNLKKSFEGAEVLKGISAVFEKGKTNLIIGQSGSGKTVFLKCLLGLFEADEGKILFEGKRLKKMSVSERSVLRQEMGMVFQGSALFDSMTVEENIKFPLTMFTKMTKGEMKKRVDYCLEHVNLVGRNKLFPSECSGGMQKRVGIARAISMNPKYLFCDEPNSGLDPKTSILIDGLIRDLTYELNMTTVVITHDMNSVIEIGDNIIFIYQGKKWWEGDKYSIIKTDNEEILKFVYASDFMKEIRNSMQSKKS